MLLRTFSHNEVLCNVTSYFFDIMKYFLMLWRIFLYYLIMAYFFMLWRTFFDIMKYFLMLF